MGSTGHGIYKKSNKGNVNDETFGIRGAVNFKGKVPADSGLSAPGSNKITLKLPTADKSNIIFQFKLTKDNKYMTIIGFRNSIPEVKCKVDVEAGNPSLDKLLANGSKAEKANALKMKDLMNKSSQVDENQLGSIAQKLLRKKQGGA